MSHESGESGDEFPPLVLAPTEKLAHSLGYSLAQLRRMTLSALAASADDLKTFLKQVRRSKAAGGILNLATEQGKIHPAFLHMHETDVEGRPVTVVAMCDIRETDGNGQADRLRAIIHDSHDAIIAKTLDGTITDWNRAAEQMYGYSAAEAVGQHISLIVPSDRREELHSIMERVARGEDIRTLETVRQRKDGTRLDISVRISPIRNTSGELVGISAVARDITNSKENERREHLRHAVAEILADAEGIETTSRRVLGVIGEQMGWDVGELWLPDDEQQQLHRTAQWIVPDQRDRDWSSFFEIQRFDYGQGVPGRIWRTGRLAWIQDMPQDGEFIRSQVATSYGQRTLMAYPLQYDHHTSGVMLFCASKIHQAPAYLENLMESIGQQIGGFLAQPNATLDR